MLSLLFYLIIILVLAAVMFILYYKRKQARNYRMRKPTHLVNFGPPPIAQGHKSEGHKQSSYDPNLVVLQLSAFPGRPYMGYELHQALLSAGLRLGDKNIFHRYADNDDRKILFSLAAATPDGSFAIENMGLFKCQGLFLFMRLNPKRKLMSSFDLMLDTARQLTEELGGEIYDDLCQFVNANVIKRLREKICLVETDNLYATDLLDNLD
ncbi:MAG: cell division protein ZipA C-terminal FtsZ-binding domain-containing protein [Coxiellaceae bacterium]|jgi:FtsZ-interacting cell division protein ZipA|nr:cell division protein ZipA C-terminal FtsZ-binding domain-containing protein [Coxiellaceae bacterium]